MLTDSLPINAEIGQVGFSTQMSGYATYRDLTRLLPSHFNHSTILVVTAALSVDKVDVPADSSGAMVVSTASEHVLGKAVLVTHYGR